MTTKNGVDLSHLHFTLLIVMDALDKIWNMAFPDDLDGLNITSGHEETSKHSEKSKHYIHNCSSGFGEAFDCRVKDVKQADATKIGVILWMICEIRGINIIILPEGFLTDNAHLHIQLQG